MLILPFTLTLVIFTSVLAPVAMAQDFTPPDREHRQGMSYEEYSSYREKMRMRMEKMTPEERRQARETMNSPSGQTERPKHDSAYGKGFHTRPQKEQMPDRPSSNRPDRPQGERFNRENMGHR